MLIVVSLVVAYLMIGAIVAVTSPKAIAWRLAILWPLTLDIWIDHRLRLRRIVREAARQSAELVDERKRTLRLISVTWRSGNDEAIIEFTVFDRRSRWSGHDTTWTDCESGLESPSEWLGPWLQKQWATARARLHGEDRNETVEAMELGLRALHGTCEYCGCPDGVELESSCTAYAWDGEGSNPNRHRQLCRSCAEEHHAYWDEMWSHVYHDVL